MKHLVGRDSVEGGANPCLIVTRRDPSTPLGMTWYVYTESCECGRRDDIQMRWQYNFVIITRRSACRRPRAKTRSGLPFVNSRANTIRMSPRIKKQRRKNLSKSMKLTKF